MNYIVAKDYEVQLQTLLEKNTTFKDEPLELSRVFAAWRAADSAAQEKETKKISASGAGDRGVSLGIA